MPDFAYIARDPAGKRVEGIIAAATEREANTSLAAQKLFPLQLKPATQRAVPIGSHRVSGKTMATFYSQLAALLRSGVPLLRSLEVLRDQTSHHGLQEVLRDVHTQVEDGVTLAEAIARHPRAFSELATSVIRAGGEGGFLEESLDRVALFTEQQDEMTSRVIGALAYPMILLVLGTLVVNGLVIFFVPKFEELFARLKERGELPAITEWLIWTSETMQNYGWLIVLALIGAGLFLRQRLATEQGRMWLDKFRLRVPQAGTIYRSLAVARFCRVLGTLLAGGVPIVRSLEISADATGNRVLSRSIIDAAENITAGESLAEPLSASGHFPRDVVEMIGVAEQANSLESVLTQIADSLEKETWRRLDLMVKLLEPLMLLLLAGFVLVVVIALLLPVLKMSTTMQ